MVNMLKVLVAVTILLIIVGIALLGKKLRRALIFKTATTPRNESLWMQWITGWLVAIIAIANYLRNTPDATIIMWLGLLVFFTGGILQFYARKQLHEDKTFEERAKAELNAATTGLYSKIRHPSKSALLLLLAGLCITTASWWALGLLLALFLPTLLYRISQEERALLDQFGDRWMAYQSDTNKLIPGML